MLLPLLAATAFLAAGAGHLDERAGEERLVAGEELLEFAICDKSRKPKVGKELRTEAFLVAESLQQI